ncbi:phosphoribosyltransferase family protein [Amycolatopsis mongoliensis]|uniref:Phosphoribosyltransferase family protein n=1 Tax=Amycolatopsis mongoliensis TaxID=715475 RepID=A0A9Y2JJZ2_9PSEU|nr:phosphoribosyltransferase family protein [Amycolatopsis sp. 4-36]WIX98248.1 phosphoribosyltransferase family protein [Amycolatopsis sp. 4-36]
MPFVDRTEAGRRLAEALEEFRGPDVVVLGLPRGGVPVAFEVARALDAPLDVLVVRKIGIPFQPELAMGAIGEGGVRVTDPEMMQACEVTEAELNCAERAERAELGRRVRRFRGGRAREPIDGRVALIVDDGVATGSTARAACRVARAEGAARVVLAVPVGAPDSVAALEADADHVVCLEAPAWFAAVGQWYDHFSQVRDEEVLDLLHRGAREGLEPQPIAVDVDDPPARDEQVEVFAGPTPLAGRIVLPEKPGGLVIQAYSSASGRYSPRHRRIADVFGAAGLGTLMIDLLTRVEEADRQLVFDGDLLAERLAGVTSWLLAEPGCEGLPVGYHGTGPGAEAVLLAAADPGSRAAAVVSHGGRPDRIADRLGRVRAPTLLIVGAADYTGIDLGWRARSHLTCVNELALVAATGTLFEEPGALDKAAGLARNWYLTHLTGHA